MMAALPAREFNRRLKTALTALREAGAKRLTVEISPDGSTRVIETAEDASEDEAARVGRLIEERMGG